MRIVDFLDRAAKFAKDRKLLIDGEESYSYGEVIEYTHRIARALRRDGIVAGESVAVLSPNAAMAMIALYGIVRADTIFVPLNPRNAVSDNAYHVVRGKTQLIFFHSSLIEDVRAIAAEAPVLNRFVALDKPVDGYPDIHQWLGDIGAEPVIPEVATDPEATWRYSMTGGTTGKAKLVLEPHRVIALQIVTLMAEMHYPTPPVYLLAAPLTHAGGAYSHSFMAMGGTIVLLAKADPKVMLDCIEKYKVTTTFAPPTLLYMMLSEPDIHSRDFSSMRYFMIAAAPLSRDKMIEAMGVFGPIMCQTFGQTEASGVLTYLSPQALVEARDNPELEHRFLSCGRPTPFSQVAIMDDQGNLLPPGEVGEIVARGLLVANGYADAPEETAASRAHGWHHTGDIGQIDEDGYLAIVDRKRDLIISGGFNVFPSEVEQVLWSHPAVQDCAVVGVPDEKWGEAVKGVVELKPGASVTEEELIAFCRPKLGGVKTPKSMEVWPTLPRSPAGKVLRREVREKYSSGERRSG